MDRRYNKPAATRVDIKGQRFGLLTVIRYASYTRGDGGHAKWLCQCDCGKTHIARGSLLRSGRTKSCGCLRRKKEAPHENKDDIAIDTGKGAHLTFVKLVFIVMSYDFPDKVVMVLYSEDSHEKEVVEIQLCSVHRLACA